jgi:hypothetical protein
MGLLSHWNCTLKVVSRVHFVQLLSSLNTHEWLSLAQVVTLKKGSETAKQIQKEEEKK